MVKPIGTLTCPIYAKLGNKEIHLGDAVVDVKYDAAGRPKAPNPREIKQLVRKGLR